MKSSSHFKICFTYELISLTSDKLAFFYGLAVNLEHRWLWNYQQPSMYYLL